MVWVVIIVFKSFFFIIFLFNVHTVSLNVDVVIAVRLIGFIY